MLLCPKDTDCVCPTTDNCWWQGSMYQQSGLQLLLLMPHGESLVDIQFLDSLTILMMVLMIVPCWTHFVHFGVFILAWMRTRIPLLKLFVCWVALWLECMHVSFHEELVWTEMLKLNALPGGTGYASHYQQHIQLLMWRPWWLHYPHG